MRALRSSAAAWLAWARLAIDPLKSDVAAIVPGTRRHGNRRHLGLFGLRRGNLRQDLAGCDITQRWAAHLVRGVGVDGWRPEQRDPCIPGGAVGGALGKLSFEAGHLGLDARLIGETPRAMKGMPAEIAEK